VADGTLEAEYVCVESEHSAMSACIGTSAAGARTFTATSSQGMALMWEILYIVSGLRLPIVLALANRALAAPLSIWNDHGDVMGARDIGWIQVFAENGQESFDQTIIAFRIAEDHRVLLPVMVNFDGFTLTHVVEAMYIESQETVDKFLPPYIPVYTLHPSKPVTMGAFAMPEVFTELRYAHQVALANSIEVIREAWKEWGDLTGRYYEPVQCYKCEDAETIVVMMGSIAEVAAAAVDEMRAKGEKVGLMRMKLWRPFPTEDVRKALEKAKLVVVCDRSITLGGNCGPVCSEIRSALWPMAKRPEVLSFIVGLGGRDVQPSGITGIVHQAQADAKAGVVKDFTVWGVRG
jgi:pyruvate ferredoxin oxidoreductase alpha subunit